MDADIIESVKCGEFVYECNILHNAHDTKRTFFKGESTLFENKEIIHSGAQSSVFEEKIFNLERYLVNELRYISVIFPTENLCEQDSLKIRTEFNTALATYLGAISPSDSDPDVKAKKETITSINKMTDPDSNINWTNKCIKRFDTSDYSTYLCTVEGILTQIHGGSRPENYRVKIYRKMIITGLKESDILSKGNMVVCEEVIIQLEVRGESANKKGTVFKNTDSCLIFTAKKSLSEQLHSSLHFQGKGAFSVLIPSDSVSAFNPITRQDDVMISVGWLVNKINNCTKNNRASVESSVTFFENIFKNDDQTPYLDDIATKQAKAEHIRRVQLIKKTTNRAHEAEESRPKAAEPTKDKIVANSFLGHQRIVNVHDRNRLTRWITWFSTPSFALVVCSPPDSDVLFLFIKTYHIAGNQNTENVITYDRNSCGTSSGTTEHAVIADNSDTIGQSGQQHKQNTGTSSTDNPEHGSKVEGPRASSRFSLHNSHLPEELELELELL
jgi:hypothetical protein